MRLSLGRVVGWRTSDEVVVFERVGVAAGGVDAEAEEVGDGSDVAAVGVCFGEDAVLAQFARGDRGTDGHAEPARADGAAAVGAAAVEEQVAVGGVWPGAGTVVEPGGDAFTYGVGKRMTRPSRVRRPSTMSVSSMRCSWPMRMPWKAISATTSAVAGHPSCESPICDCVPLFAPIIHES